MKMKPISFFSSAAVVFFLVLMVFPSAQKAFAQQITPKGLEFNQICAGGPHPTKPGEIFNEYQASFSISGFASDAKFKVELSDVTGSFTSPTATTTLPPLSNTPPDTATDKTLVFAVPTNLVGSSTYRLRVVTLAGDVVSQPFSVGSTTNKIFPAYFKPYNDSFAINNNLASVSFCFGGSVTLTVYNPTPSIPGSSPANYPQLAYKWYKDEVLVPGQTSSSLSVNTNGVYYAVLDYGQCSDVNFRSQSVTVNSGSGASATIVSSAGNPFCPSSGSTTLSITAGNTYQWKKDNVVIPGATSQNYVTSSAGVYSCDVDFGGCKSTGKIDLKVSESNSAISGVTEGKVNYITEGETIQASITTDAVSPTYEWFLNGTAIPGADKSSLDISSAGKYEGHVTQNSGCIGTDVFPFEISFKVNYNAEKIANIVTPNGDGVNDTWIIPDQYLAGTNTHIMILSSLGEVVFETDSYDNYNGWPNTGIEFKNFNPVYYYIITPTSGSAKKGSITLVK